jgi:hypothetical protein
MVTITTVGDDWLRKAEQLRENLATRTEALAADRRLSDAAKLSRMAATYLGAKRQMDELAQQHANLTAAHQRKLERQAFGIDDIAGHGTLDRATASIGYRDAQDRVAKLTEPGEAQTLLSRAERSGDELLARAVAAHAAEQGWTDVLTTYTATRPTAAAALEQLEQAQAGGTARDLFAWVTPAPSALAGVNDVRLRELAADAALTGTA